MHFNAFPLFNQGFITVLTMIHQHLASLPHCQKNASQTRPIFLHDFDRALWFVGQGFATCLKNTASFFVTVFLSCGIRQLFHFLQRFGTFWAVLFRFLQWFSISFKDCCLICLDTVWSYDSTMFYIDVCESVWLIWEFLSCSFRPCFMISFSSHAAVFV